VNGGEWAQLEGAVHALAATRGTVWVFSGPVFAGKTPMKSIGPEKVAVPTHTYKVVLCVHPNGDKEMFGFVLPNIAKPTGTITSYTLGVDQVEKLTGLDFSPRFRLPSRVAWSARRGRCRSRRARAAGGVGEPYFASPARCTKAKVASTVPTHRAAIRSPGELEPASYDGSYPKCPRR
jgi:hypothetical protein